MLRVAEWCWRSMHVTREEVGGHKIRETGLENHMKKSSRALRICLASVR
jgi:hypothetical protein